jgi:hypothetical protein
LGDRAVCINMRRKRRSTTLTVKLLLVSRLDDEPSAEEED